VTAFCVFCGKPIPETEYRVSFVEQRYCSVSCAKREQLAVRRLRETSPPVVSAWQCQQPGCQSSTETWCPLCEKFLCSVHDELTPHRMHDCLAGPADAMLTS